MEVRPQMKGLFKEFETFAIRGNWIELAVGVLVGASFNQVTTALATGILTPLIGLLGAGYDFSHLAVRLNANTTIQYGALIQAAINFIITAFVLFFFVKGINRLARRRKEEEKKEEKAQKLPEESAEVKILKEIRDELRRST